MIDNKKEQERAELHRTIWARVNYWSDKHGYQICYQRAVYQRI